MCQVKSKRVHRKKVVGYRVYNVTQSGLVRSYYNCLPIADIDIKTEKNTDEPFHAFSSKRSLFNWIKKRLCHNFDNIVIYKCELEGELKRGVWQDWAGTYFHITTVTGNICTLVEKMDIAQLNKEYDAYHFFKERNREGLVFKSTITSTYGSYTKDAYKVKHWEPTSKI